MGNKYPRKKDGTCYADEREEEINRFFREWIIGFSDRAEIDEETESQAQEERNGFDHSP